MTRRRATPIPYPTERRIPMLCSSILVVVPLAFQPQDPGPRPGPDEIGRAHRWSVDRFGEGGHAPSEAPPFSFVYAGRPSADLAASWRIETRTEALDATRISRTSIYTDPATGLIVTCDAVEYRDFPTVEWTLAFENGSDVDTPILEDIRPMDFELARTAGEFRLHWNTPDNCTPDSYAPHVETLGPGAVFRSASADGRPTSGGYPYWNFEFDDGGCIAVLGWPGQWSATFQRDADRGVRLRAGQELTRFALRPRERVRAPIAVVQFYRGDWIRGQNQWRRWMVAHNLPRPGGELVPTHYAACFANLQPLAEEEIGSIDGLAREGVKLDYWILDAGWYVNRGGWWDTGTWEVDRSRFPRGVREVSDRAHANGMGFVLWFEPGRANGGTWLAENHPEWILGGRNGGALNFGDPDAWKWAVETIDGLIVSEGVDVYRQDHNIGPIGLWRANDAQDRQGITEIQNVTGYLAFWDELLRRHPRLWIDSCASGGRRNDLETLRRSVPLLRSDAFDSPITQQCQTYGLSLWVPYSGSGTGIADEYMFRSCIFPASRVGIDARRRDLDYALVKRMVAEFRRVQPFLLDDYYPLTPYSLAKDAWIAWQFDSPEKGGGFVQAFRREDTAADAVTLALRGLDPAATYAMEDLDDGEIARIGGGDLMQKGLRVTLSQRPSAALLVYRRLER